MTQTPQASINIPQLIAVALVGFLAIRWYLSKPSNTVNNGGTPSSAQSWTIDVAKVEQVSAMFPQVDQRCIAWDLHSNGWSIAATTERILAGRPLDSPPPSFRPDLPSAVAARPAADGETPAAVSQQPNLIARYGLQSKINGKGKEPLKDDVPERIAWSSDKVSRADNLRKRREEMILRARRKMQEAQESARS